MVKKEKMGIKMKSTHSRGSISCQHGIGQKQSPIKDALCEICDKVFKTDKDIHIYPKCQSEDNKSYI